MKKISAFLILFCIITALLPISAFSADTEIFKADFEKSTNGFKSRGTAMIEQITSVSKNGKGSLYVSDRGDQNWHSASLTLTKYIVPDGEYEISVWVYIPDDTPDTKIILSFEMSIGGNKSWPWLDGGNELVEAGKWVQLTGTKKIESTEKIDYINLNIETDDAGKGNSYYIDDVIIKAIGNTTVLDIEPEPEPELDMALPSLKDAYKDYFMIGTVYNTKNQVGLDKDIILKHFNAITAENMMKPNAMQPTEGNFGFGPADTMVKWCEENDLPVMGHTLVWHEQSGGWMAASGDRETAIKQLKEHIEAVAGHYKGKVYAWDALNEAIGNTTNPEDWRSCLRETAWYKAIGPDYVEMIFKFAAEADPNALLYYNDYNLDEDKKADVVYYMVKELKEKGVKIDGIGMQGHYNTATSPAAVERSIKKFESLGVKISVTELDVTVQSATGDSLTENEAIAQGKTYAALFKVYKKYSDTVERVTIWGYEDGSSWRGDKFPVLFDRYFRAKPAFYAVLDPDKFLEEHSNSAGLNAKRAIASKGTPQIDGEIDAVWNNAKTIDINSYAMAWSGASAKARLLWDEDYLYVLYEVADPVLSDKSENEYEQDSVEVFIDENNGKTPYYEEDDAQYRVNYKNIQSFGSGCLEDRLKSAAKITDKGYIAEFAVPFKTIKGKEGMILGWEGQVNDDNKGDGVRNSVAKFNDLTDLSYQNTEQWGEVGLGDLIGNFTEKADTNIEDIEDIDPLDGIEGDIKVILDGQNILFDQPPVMSQERVMVPMRKIFALLGCSVVWNDEAKTVTATKADKIIILQIDSDIAKIDTRIVNLDAPPVIVNDRTLVPIRFVSEALGCDVEWDGINQTVVITSK